MTAEVVLAIASGVAFAQAQPNPSIIVEADLVRTPTTKPAKLDHILPEVDGTRITVTKKTSTTKLDQQPPVFETQGRELFARTPGLLVSEQQTPTQYNLS